MSQATVAVSIIGLQGRPLSNTAPTTNQALMWNGTAWLPGGPFLPLTGGTLTGNIITSGNIQTTAGSIQSPGNGGSFINGTGYNIRTQRGGITKGGLTTQFSTTSGSLVMCGIGGQFTPRTSGTIFLGTSCQIAVNVANCVCLACQLYGTGTPPAQGAAQTGSGTGYGTSFNANSNTGGVWVPWSQMSIVAGLTVGTTYWADIAISTANTATNAYAQWGMVWVTEL